MSAELTSLVERLEKAKGPDREIDAELLCIAVPAMRPLFSHWTAEQIEYIVPRYTASIDATVALVGRVKPDANCWGVDKDERGIQAHVSRNGVSSGHWYSGAEHKSSPAIALCLALLRSLTQAGE